MPEPDAKRRDVAQRRPRPGAGRASWQERRRPDDDGPAVLYGWHPVLEAVRNPKRRVRRLVLTENAARRLAEAVEALPVEPEMARPSDIDRLLEPDAVHQGFYCEADPLPSPAVETLSDTGLVLALDQVTDPHNVGAIVRSAAAFGVEAIITTARHSPAATGVLAKAASGGLEHVPFLVVRNLAETLIALGERGFYRIGLDSEGDTALGDLPLRRPLVLTLGAEGKGLRERTRACCDVLARLVPGGPIQSLNVSNAAAVALYALTRPGV